jgi:hypothetical protein
MDKNQQLLDFIYKNASMGVYTIKQSVCIAKSEDFRKLLESQLEGYKAVLFSAKGLYDKYALTEKEPGFCKRFYACMMLNLETTFNNTDSKLAELAMIGNNMGIIKATKNLKKYSDADEEIKTLMEKLLQEEEKNVQQLKNYL